MDTLTNHQSVMSDEIDSSFIHKLKRIRKQENFKIRNKVKFDSLTKREIEVIFLLARDHNNPQIAETLCISRYTVEQHRKNINRKLGINSYFQLFQYALAFNLI